MNNQTILSTVAVVLAGLALVSSLYRGPGAAPAGSGLAEPSAAAGPAQVDGALAQRVGQLAEETRRLGERMTALENRPAGDEGVRTMAGDGVVLREDLDAFRDEVRSLIEGMGPGAKPRAGKGDLEQEVASSLSRIRAEETAAAARAAEAKRLVGLDRRMSKIDGWLGLTPAQSGDMRSALLTQMEREAELTRRWKSGEDAEALGELKASDRHALRTELSAILTPEQLATYLEGGSERGK